MTFVPQPNSGQTLGQTRDQMRSNTNLLRDAIAVNHVDLNQSDVGKHKFVVMPVQVAAPTTLANEAAIYSKSVGSKSQVFFIRDATAGTECALTAGDTSNANFAGTSPGWTFLPGGLMMQWGVVAAASSSSFPVTFSPVFSSPPVCIQVTGTRAGSSPGNTDAYVVNSSVTAAGFTIYNNGSHNMGFYWVAIGAI